MPVEFDLPTGRQVRTDLVKTSERHYFAPDYDDLVDCPVRPGTFQSFSFESHGRPIAVVLDGAGDIEFDSAAWLGNLERIVDTQREIFGGFPFDRYTFLYSADPVQCGYVCGLEQLTSTMIGIGPGPLPHNPPTGTSVTAHEFIYLWKVKRMRPIELGAFDYTRPIRTTWLWIAAGFTSYSTSGKVIAPCSDSTLRLSDTPRVRHAAGLTTMSRPASRLR